MRKASNAANRSSGFQPVFDQLKQLVRDAAAGTKLVVTADTPGSYSLTAGYSERFKKDLWFGGVRLGKRYASLHLMPVYMNARLLDELSPALRARMQGKSCFNFRAPLEPGMQREVATLIARCIRGFSMFIDRPEAKQMKHEDTKSRSRRRASSPAS